MPRGRTAVRLASGLALASLAALSLFGGEPARAGAGQPGKKDEVTIDLVPRFSAPGPAFEGWGTALAWFGHVTGQFPDFERNRLADLLYGPDGLRLNIARYNIGGGNAPETKPYLRPGAEVPGFWLRPPGMAGNDWWNPGLPGHWNWAADQGQRWWLDAIRKRVPSNQLIFEAFSNSPPYFMTVSGLVSGNQDGLADNIRPGQEDRFAQYLVQVTQELERRHGIVFRTLSPVNEPNTPYWFANNTQEGAHWTPEAQSRMFVALDKALKARGMKTQISGPDETNAQTFALDWAGLSPAAKGVIGQINVHSYETIGKSGVRDVATVTGKRLWMSEVDLSPANVREDQDDMRPAIALAEQVINDIGRLNPSAWVLWQAVENVSSDAKTSSNWGLIKTDYTASANPRFSVTRKYWAFGNFTRFIKPGYHFIPVSDQDSAVATSGDGRKIVLVHVNPGLVARRIVMRLPAAFGKAGLHCAAYVTGRIRDLSGSDVPACARNATIEAPAMAVTTVVFTAAR